MMLSNEESGAHRICVASIKQEPDDGIDDWIIEENIHSDDDDDGSTLVNRSEVEVFVKKEPDEISVNKSLNSSTGKLKQKLVSKRNTLSKQCSEEAVTVNVAHNRSSKAVKNPSHDVVEHKDGNKEIKVKPGDIIGSNVDSQNSPRMPLQTYEMLKSMLAVRENATSNSLPTSESFTNSKTISNITLRKMLMHVPTLEINSSTSANCQTNDTKPPRTFSNKSWLPRLTELIKSKSQTPEENKDLQDQKQLLSNVSTGMNTKYGQFLKDLVFKTNTERSKLNEIPETQPRLLTVHTLSTLLTKNTGHLKVALAEPVSEEHFDCKECEKSFGTFASLVAHKKYHRLRQKLVCGTCQKEFSVRREFERHLKKHVEPVELVCTVCQKVFSVVGALKRHMLIHGQQPTGDDKFYTDGLYGEGVEKCPVCGDKFSKYYIKYHMKIHSSDRPHKCNKCGRTFTHKQSLVAHKLKHKREMIVWNCEFCDRIFDYEYLLKRHMKLHTKYKCNKCDKTLRNKASYLSHWRTHNTSSYCCDICNRTYSRYSAYFSHYQSHKNLERMPLPENKAITESSDDTDQEKNDMTVVEKSDGETHYNLALDTKHSEENESSIKLIAENCHDSRDYDSVPIPISDTGKPIQTPHTCHVCKWDATSPCALKRHMRVHAPKAVKGDNLKDNIKNLYKEGIVECPFCEEKFSKYNIKQHVKIHCNDRSYTCDICFKSFLYKASLAAHVLAHQRQTVKWYCHFCDRNFDYEFLFKRHMKTHGSGGFHILNLKTSKDLSSPDGISSSTVLPEPSIEIDNADKETLGKDILNSVFPKDADSENIADEFEMEDDQVHDGHYEKSDSITDADVPVDPNILDCMQSSVERCENVVTVKNSDTVSKNLIHSDDDQTLPGELSNNEDSDTDLELKVQFATG